MINKLRKKIIAINVISVCIIFFVATLFIFSSGFARIDDERTMRMQMLLDYDGRPGEDLDILRTVAFVDIDLVTHQETWIIGKDSGLSAQHITPHLQRAIKSDSSNGTLTPNLRYLKKVEGNHMRIVFCDRFATAQSIRPYFVVVLAVVVFAAGCYFVISWTLARIALKPVEENWAQQKQFVADASHELKTPLSVIMANTEIIASHANETVASQMQWIQNTQAEAQRMAGLVSDLLFLAKNDDGLKVQMTNVNFGDCVASIAISHEALFYENGKQFTYNVTDANVIGNEGQLKQLATILLDNANKYSVGQGNVKLNLSVSGKHVVFSVSNDCETLTETHLAHLFDRFYTVDPSRNKNNVGNGLGLSIAKIICQTHGGNIVVKQHNGRIYFVATLPLAKNKKD